MYRSRRLGISRAVRWTRSSMLRKMQHVKCIPRATSDGLQACMHGIDSVSFIVDTIRARTFFSLHVVDLFSLDFVLSTSVVTS